MGSLESDGGLRPWGRLLGSNPGLAASRLGTPGQVHPPCLSVPVCGMGECLCDRLRYSSRTYMILTRRVALHLCSGHSACVRHP